MQDKDKSELDKEIKDLTYQKEQIEDQIRNLDEKKIKRLQDLTQDLEIQVEKLDKEKVKIKKERDNLLRQIKKIQQKKWPNTLVMISVLTIIDLIVLPLIVFTLHVDVLWLFISLGIVTFFGILAIANYMSGTSPFNTGEVRKALTGSFIIVYFAFIPIATLSSSVSVFGVDLIRSITTDFTWLLAIIIVLYFGTRAFEEYIKT